MKYQNLKNKNSEIMKTKFVKITMAAFILVFCGAFESKASNIVFSFSTITTNTTGTEAMDLFSVGSALISNSTTPNVYFALGFVDSSFSFSGKSRTELLTAIGSNYIGSSAASWTTIGTASGGKENVLFNNGGLGFNTTVLGWAGKQLVAVVSQGVNPMGGTFLDDTKIAIVRGGTVSDGTQGTAWNSILSTDASPSLTTQALDVRSFNQILYGTYTANVGTLAVPTTVTKYYDTISLIPEPSSASLLALGMAGLVALRIRRKS